ncbi:pyruvate, water dikinase [Thermoflexales bacterium]|nr:pyruvate, water dikinase [Thermoflexales bacterium]
MALLLQSESILEKGNAMAYILRLDHPEATLDKVGGKGASLARLAQAGLPVPDGFHVTTAAYRQFVAENNLQPAILNALEQADVARPDSLEAASHVIHDLFAQAHVPSAIADEIGAAYRSLATKRGSGDESISVAVRSSATAEDLPEASFAGQQDTYLNILGREAVLSAVKRCWASLWTARAISYRARQGISMERVVLAVVVQQLVTAKMAGILFTANPLTGRRDEAVINAAWGLGEAIVGGRVTPDTLIVDKAAGRVKQAQVAEKAIMTVRTSNGTKEQPVEESRRKERVLSDTLAAKLTALGCQIEAAYGAPQDIEWCYTSAPSPNGIEAGGEAGQFFIVQARPITTLFPLPTPLPTPEDGLRIYLCVNVVLQGITEPFTPLGWEIFRLSYAGMIDSVTGKLSTAYPAWVKDAAGRMYVDPTDLLRNPKIGKMIARWLAAKDPVASQALLQVLQVNADKIQSKQKLKLPWRMFFTIVPNMVGPAIYSFLAPRAAREKMYAMGEAWLAPLEQRARQLTGRTDRLHFVEDAARKLFWTAFYEVAYCSSGLRSMELIPALLKKWLGADTLAQPVLQALPHNPTTEMGQELLRIARRLQIEQAAPAPDHPAVQEFLKRFGHRAVREIDTGLPRWSEDPTYVVEMLATYLAQGNLESKLEQFRAAQAEAEASIPRVVAEVRRCKGRLPAWIIGHLLRCLREAGGMREQPKFDLIRCFALLRHVLLEVGQDLVTQGQLDKAEDVFYLTWANIQASGDLRPRAAEARAAYRREVGRTAVPRIMTSTGECFYSAPAVGDHNTLVGAPVSPGVYTGMAHIVHAPLGAQLERGEILVTHSTDPSWTPLFLNAGAVIMETGGPISHGAIVAREYGIPAVAGVSEATTRLRTGQRLRVNGETGEIVCLE